MASYYDPAVSVIIPETHMQVIVQQLYYICCYYTMNVDPIIQLWPHMSLDLQTRLLGVHQSSGVARVWQSVALATPISPT